MPRGHCPAFLATGLACALDGCPDGFWRRREGRRNRKPDGIDPNYVYADYPMLTGARGRHARARSARIDSHAGCGQSCALPAGRSDTRSSRGQRHGCEVVRHRTDSAQWISVNPGLRRRPYAHRDLQKDGVEPRLLSFAVRPVFPSYTLSPYCLPKSDRATRRGPRPRAAPTRKPRVARPRPFPRRTRRPCCAPDSPMCSTPGC